MHENRTTYPKRKASDVSTITRASKKYKVVSLIKMEKVRSTQILPLRKILKDDVEFVSIKDKVAKKKLLNH